MYTFKFYFFIDILNKSDLYNVHCLFFYIKNEANMIEIDRQLVRQIDIWIDRQIERYIDRLIDRQKNECVKLVDKNILMHQKICTILQINSSQIDRWKERYIDRQKDRQVERQIDRYVEKQIDSQAERQIDTQVERQIVRQKDRQIVRQKDRQLDK